MKKIKSYNYATDATSGVIEASSLTAAYKQMRDQITDKMIDDGATLWVEDINGLRITMGR